MEPVPSGTYQLPDGRLITLDLFTMGWEYRTTNAGLHSWSKNTAARTRRRSPLPHSVSFQCPLMMKLNNVLAVKTACIKSPVIMTAQVLKDEFQSERQQIDAGTVHLFGCLASMCFYTYLSVTLQQTALCCYLTRYSYSWFLREQMLILSTMGSYIVPTLLYPSLTMLIAAEIE